ncbi:MAG: hypothetical protein AB1390_09820 [Nitrospirota bacterium]
MSDKKKTDETFREALTKSYIARAKLFYTSIKEKNIAYLASRIKNLEPKDIAWNLSELGINEKAFNLIKKTSINPLHVFCHPEVLLAKPDFAEYYRNLAAVSKKLFTPKKSETVDIRWEDPQYMTLLYSIESAVKRICEDNPELTDSSVILALESLALKPENVNNDVIVKAINLELRLQLSMSDYSRNEVKRAIRKILNSARKHNKAGGIRGYLDFIFEHVP